MSGEMTFHLGVTLYSFNHEFYTYRYSFEECMELVGTLGAGQGVEIVGPQMIRSFPELSEEFERRFKRAVEKNHLRPTAYGAYADPQRITGRLLTHEEQTEYLRTQIRSAHQLGFPVVRLQAVEPVFSDLLPYAEKLGVKMGIEIHAPNMIEEMQETIERVERINSPFLGFVPDCGAFCRSCARVYIDRFHQLGVNARVADRILALWRERPSAEKMASEVRKMGGGDLEQLMATESRVYFGHSDPQSLNRIMPHIVHIHGKFFGIDQSGTESAVRFPEIVSVLKNGGYAGSISCEYEGHHWTGERDVLEQIRALQALIVRECKASAQAPAS
ncbi:MAG TPA: TIM barrel protein [Patescibacteria group bacterium]|nr:TIM barrel protein [Patescibacteria group bacterium]